MKPVTFGVELFWQKLILLCIIILHADATGLCHILKQIMKSVTFGVELFWQKLILLCVIILHADALERGVAFKGLKGMEM